MKLQFCPYCGKKLDDGARFCKNCGEALIQNQKPDKESILNEPLKTETPQSIAEPVKEDKRTGRKTVYDGEIHKCPNCGEIIDAYDMSCKSCGYEIRGREITSVVHELSLKLENTPDFHKKDELIRTFYIPNTREDIHEFFILALSHIKIGGTNTDAWMVKLEQAYQKAELLFCDTPEFERLKPMYENAQLLNKKNSTLGFIKNTKEYFKSGYAWALLFFVIGSLFSLLPGLGDIAGGLRLIALIIAVVTLYGRAWRALDK